MTRHASGPTDDRGTVLPLVLVFVVVLSFIAAGISRYAGVTLRYSTVVADRTAAAASAEAGLRFAIDRVGTNSVTSCENGPVRIAPTHSEADNGAVTTIACSRLDAGPATSAGWAAVVTGDGIGSDQLEIDDFGPNVATGRVFVSSPRDDDLDVNGSGSVRFGGDVFYDGSSDDCGIIEQYGGSSYDAYTIDGALVCWPQTWEEVVDEPRIDPAVRSLLIDPPSRMVDDCRVFEPGRYQNLTLNRGGDNYFRSGSYLFEDLVIVTADSGSPETFILAGSPHDARFQPRLPASAGRCEVARAADAVDGGPEGVTWYFGGSSRIILRYGTTLEMLPMVHTDPTDPTGTARAVSVHVLGPGSVLPESLGDGDQVIDAQNNGSFPYNDVLIQGQIWSPTQAIDLEDAKGDTNGQITSGVVASQLLVESTTGSVGSLGPDATPVDQRLELTSVATVHGISVEARAVVF